MTIDLAQFHDAFFEESFEAIDSMEAALLKLDVGAPDKELINTIFRVAHSIKGGSATFGFSEIASFTHSLETMLDELRSGTMQVSPAISDLLLKSVDVMRAMLRAVQLKQPIDAQKVSDLQFDLELMIAQKKTVPQKPDSAPPAAAAAPAAPAAPAAVASNAPATGTQARAAVPAVQPAGGNAESAAELVHWRIAFRPYPELFARGNDPLRMLRELARLGELQVQADLEPLPAFAALEPQSCYLAWSLELHGAVSESAIRQVFEWAEGDCDLQVDRLQPVLSATTASQPSSNADAQAPTMTAPPAAAPSASVITLPTAATASTPNVSGAVPAAAASAAPAPSAVSKDEVRTELPMPTAPDSGSIRVSVEKIDELMNTVGELVITQAMLSQLSTGLEGTVAEKLRGGLAQLERNMRELQESVMRVRMLPINTVFSRFPRMVRDLAQRLGKQIELKMTGEQTELDKTVLEKIGDPLVHLIRNSIDHGIESPAARAAAGKPPAGTVHLDACHRGGNIAVEVSDDGGGLDKDRILAKARDRGLVGPEDVLSDEQVYDLIFMPGFSTVDKTTDVSGRGVGMDVVRRNVKELGGKIELRSQRGKGSKCIITLPLTLAIVDGQSVAVGSETYIVPLVSIVESMQLRSSSISRLSGQGEVFSFRGYYLPIVRLYEVFGVEPRTRALDEGLVVVAEGEGHQRIGLFVDDLLGQQQVVIKSLETNYGHIEGVSGATILGDGSVALILDVPGLIRALSTRAAA
ncbi:MAG TPA: chemotaxis protein CheA [Steroidobacteraceae bacterium]|nr:chemotaxis protein CheA [Steroidobacteraceae bacterium]